MDLRRSGEIRFVGRLVEVGAAKSLFSLSGGD